MKEGTTEREDSRVEVIWKGKLDIDGGVIKEEGEQIKMKGGQINSKNFWKTNKDSHLSIIIYSNMK